MFINNFNKSSDNIKLNMMRNKFSHKLIYLFLITLIFESIVYFYSSFLKYSVLIYDEEIINAIKIKYLIFTLQKFLIF